MFDFILGDTLELIGAFCKWVFHVLGCYLRGVKPRTFKQFYQKRDRSAYDSFLEGVVNRILGLIIIVTVLILAYVLVN
jgi:hypothetical protein